MQEINQLRSAHYINQISQYKHKASAAFNSLKSSIQSLKSFYETILPEYQAVTASTSVSTATSTSINDILNVVYNNKYDETQIQGIQTFLSDQQEILLNESTIDEEKLKDLAKFMEAFNAFAKYAELKNQIDGFVNDDLCIPLLLFYFDRPYPHNILYTKNFLNRIYTLNSRVGRKSLMYFCP